KVPEHAIIVWVVAAITFSVNVGGSFAGSSRTARNRAPWYKPPQLLVMTGFIANTTNGVWGRDFIVNGQWSAKKQQTALAEWNKNLGKDYNAESTVQAFKDAGATGIAFYDKWHDGLIPHATRLTGFKTERDLVGDTIRAAKKCNMASVVVYSVGLDYNPQRRFLEWSCRDSEGNPLGLAFPSDWKSFHSPYRQYVIDQLVEIVREYGPLEGLFLDLFIQPSPYEPLCRIIRPRPRVSHDAYTREAFRVRFGKPLEQATSEEIQDFVLETLRDFLSEIREKVSEVQPDISFTWNGAGMNDIVQPKKAKLVDGQADWFSMEGHTWQNIDYGARLARAADRPVEVGMLLNSSWYVPMSNEAPPPAMSECEAIVRAATAWIHGANVFACVTPGHSGIYDDSGDLRLLRAIGGWLKDNRPWLVDTLAYADIGILTGNPSPELRHIPMLAEIWEASHRAFKADAGPFSPYPGFTVARGLQDFAYFTVRVGGSFAGHRFELNSYRMLVVPETALLDESTLQEVREYVRSGGNVLGFGHASLFDREGKKRANFGLSDVFGVKLVGTLPGYKQLALYPESGLTSSMRLNPGALAVKATSGKVLAFWKNAGDPPAIVENRFGKGKSI
ncbi:MAG: alpha-L-fucosidase, partial [Thermodesulfobacteriota bacterium]